MIAFIRLYWSQLACFLLGSLFAGLVCILYTDDLKAHHEVELNKQADAMIAQCNKQKSITEERSRAFQNKLSVTNTKLRRLREQAPECVSVTSPAGGSDAAAGSGQIGLVDSNSVAERFAECDDAINQLTELQGFVNDTWELNKQ